MLNMHKHGGLEHVGYLNAKCRQINEDPGSNITNNATGVLCWRRLTYRSLEPLLLEPRWVAFTFPFYPEENNVNILEMQQQRPRLNI